MFVIGAICAMMIGLIFPTYSSAGHFARGGAVECPHSIVKPDVSVGSYDGAPSQAPRHSGLPGCPDCCLTACLGTAVLVLRSFFFARPQERVASRMRYSLCAASPLKPMAAEPANGARAPPAA
ncbi:hypothetical protein B1812_06440 [Methylocystis bryophila]|uniref:DUF2946 domain-containing protein n=1 Tax=Methylocystis bryophila TaxID=655015 RepID=A0A1W6MT22_9HYPH|nr:hypothetical protein B1812_06440 [Methylocystis bryophila]